MPGKSTLDPDGQPVKRTTLSLPPKVYEAAVARQKGLEYPSFSEYVKYLVEGDLEKRPDHVQVRRETNAPKRVRTAVSRKQRRAHRTDVEWVSMAILGLSSCGKLVVSDECTLGSVRIPKGKYPKDAFGIYATGDSMNVAKLPDGRVGIKSGDIAVCRSLEHERADIRRIVVTVSDGETCIKRLAEDADGKYLLPESSNRKHQPITLEAHARVQAVVIDALPRKSVLVEKASAL